MCSRPFDLSVFPIHVARVPAAPFARSCLARPLLPFQIAVPGFLGAPAALSTSRRKVNSRQRLVALSPVSLIP